MSDEANFDLAEILADRERQTAIDAAKGALKRSGSRLCAVCNVEIEHEALEKVR